MEGQRRRHGDHGLLLRRGRLLREAPHGAATVRTWGQRRLWRPTATLGLGSSESGREETDPVVLFGGAVATEEAARLQPPVRPRRRVRVPGRSTLSSAYSSSDDVANLGSIVNTLLKLHMRLKGAGP